MPPWLPDPGSPSFENERRLTGAELGAIEAWVAQGAHEGVAADRPQLPVWTDRWQLGTPDLVVELPEAYALQPATTDAFRTFVLPVPIQSVRYVRGVEVRPGNPQVVHHVTLALDPTSSSRRLDDADPGPGFGGGMFSPDARNPENRALGWTPGITPRMEPDGMAWRLEPNTDLVLEFHMLPSRTGEVALVKPSVGLYFADRPPTRPSIDFKLGSKAIDIPPGKSDYAIEDTFVVPVDVEVLSVYPHAH